jgi:hypothetical protein
LDRALTAQDYENLAFGMTAIRKEAHEGVPFERVVLGPREWPAR